jgi:hypothetical protein
MTLLASEEGLSSIEFISLLVCLIGRLIVHLFIHSFSVVSDPIQTEMFENIYVINPF